MALKVDYTGSDLTLLLKRNNYAPFVFEMEDTDLTGWTAPRILLAEALGETALVVQGELTVPVEGKGIVPFTTAVWSTIPALLTAGVWQFQILDIEEELHIWCSGKFKIEGSLT